MFMLWLWPKEVRELVKKYRAEGTLNVQAVEYINQRISYALAFNTLGAIIATFTTLIIPSISSYWPYVVFVSVLFCGWDIFRVNKKLACHYVIPISEGKKVEGVLEKIEKHSTEFFTQSGWIVQYRFNYGNHEYSHKLHLDSNQDCTPNYSKGDRIFVYINPKNVNESIPAFEPLVTKYKLNKGHAQ